MTLYGMMEIFQRRPDLQQMKNAFLMQPPAFHFPTHPRGLIPRPQIAPPQNNAPTEKPKTSFLITDILSGHVGKCQQRRKRAEVTKPADESPGLRDWSGQWMDGASSRSSSPGVGEDEEEIDVGEEQPKAKTPVKGSPLDALFKMTNKTFDAGENGGLLADGDGRDQMSGIFSKSQPAKKRRKSRTAFSNHQIYELEKRFLYQKYLTPADRDEIAQQLGLSNAQVITWFQNRRAKLKRDLEELKADMSAAKLIGKDPPTILTRLEEMQAYTTRQSLLKWEKRNLKAKGDNGAVFNPMAVLDEDNSLDDSRRISESSDVDACDVSERVNECTDNSELLSPLEDKLNVDNRHEDEHLSSQEDDDSNLVIDMRRDVNTDRIDCINTAPKSPNEHCEDIQVTNS